MRYDVQRNDKYIPYIRIWKNRQTGRYTYDQMLKTIDMDNLIIYKSSNVFREVSYEEFSELNYCKYLFMDKKEKDNTEKWLEFIKVNNINLRFLDKPFPKFYKINIIEFEKLKKKIG